MSRSISQDVRIALRSGAESQVIREQHRRFAGNPHARPIGERRSVLSVLIFLLTRASWGVLLLARGILPEATKLMENMCPPQGNR